MYPLPSYFLEWGIALPLFWLNSCLSHFFFLFTWISCLIFIYSVWQLSQISKNLQICQCKSIPWSFIQIPYCADKSRFRTFNWFNFKKRNNINFWIKVNLHVPSFNVVFLIFYSHFSPIFVDLNDLHVTSPEFKFWCHTNLHNLQTNCCNTTPHICLWVCNTTPQTCCYFMFIYNCLLYAKLSLGCLWWDQRLTVSNYLGTGQLWVYWIKDSVYSFFFIFRSWVVWLDTSLIFAQKIKTVKQ